MCKWSWIFISKHLQWFVVIALCGGVWPFTKDPHWEKWYRQRISCICLLTVQCMISCWHVNLSSGSSAAFYAQEIARTHASLSLHTQTYFFDTQSVFVFFLPWPAERPLSQLALCSGSQQVPDDPLWPPPHSCTLAVRFQWEEHEPMRGHKMGVYGSSA